MRRVSVVLFGLAALGFGQAVLAQDPIIYPSQGQSPEQMEQDKYQCYSWAKGQTGFDPMETPTATSAPPPQENRKGGVARGAIRGAAIGGIIDGSDGAEKGAAAGALLGGMRRSDQRRRQQQAQQQWEQEQAASYNQRRNHYNRAYGACLEGRGYTVR